MDLQAITKKLADLLGKWGILQRAPEPIPVPVPARAPRRSY